nr:hypothetical protein [Streptomyces sp. CC53]
MQTYTVSKAVCVRCAAEQLVLADVYLWTMITQQGLCEVCAVAHATHFLVTPETTPPSSSGASPT